MYLQRKLFTALHLQHKLIKILMTFILIQIKLFFVTKLYQKPQKSERNVHWSQLTQYTQISAGHTIFEANRSLHTSGLAYCRETSCD